MLNEEKLAPLLEDVVKLIALQKNKYSQLIKINRDIIGKASFEGNLEDLMAKRDAIFSQLIDLSGLMQSYQKQIAEVLGLKKDTWATILGADNLKENKIINDQLIELAQVIEELKGLDSQLISCIEKKQSETQKEIGTIHNRHKLENAYHDFGGSFPEPQMFDKTK